MTDKAIPNIPPVRSSSARISLTTAMLAAAALAASPAAAIAAPIDIIAGDLAVLYSVYPGLTNPNTGSTGG